MTFSLISSSFNFNIPSISIYPLRVVLISFANFNSYSASARSLNLGSWWDSSTNLNTAESVKCRSSGRPNFSKSQLLRSTYPGAIGITRESLRERKGISSGTFICSTTPNLSDLLKIKI